MTGAPEEEEMMREVEGEAWMTGHVVVVMTPNPGSPSGDLVSLYQNLYQNFNFDINTKFSSLIIYLKNGLFSRTAQQLFRCNVYEDDEKKLLLQVVGVSGRRPERRAGVLLVMTMMKKMMMIIKEGKDPTTASENLIHKGVLNRPVQRV